MVNQELLVYSQMVYIEHSIFLTCNFRNSPKFHVEWEQKMKNYITHFNLFNIHYQFTHTCFKEFQEYIPEFPIIVNLLECEVSSLC